MIIKREQLKNARAFLTTETYNRYKTFEQFEEILYKVPRLMVGNVSKLYTYIANLAHFLAFALNENWKEDELEEVVELEDFAAGALTSTICYFAIVGLITDNERLDIEKTLKEILDCVKYHDIEMLLVIRSAYLSKAKGKKITEMEEFLDKEA